MEELCLNPKFSVRNNSLELPWEHFSGVGVNFVRMLEAMAGTNEATVSVWDIGS